jgi:nucleoside-triphosphatase THEP1
VPVGFLRRILTAVAETWNELDPMTCLRALVYSDTVAANRTLRAVAHWARGAGLRLAGVLQRDEIRTGRSRCDKVLEDLSGAVEINISQDRGSQARGCHLNVSELLRAMQLVASGLERGPDLLIVNKFGKTEVEGGGFRELIVQAVEQGVPVLVAVPQRNLASWRAFAGELANEIDLDQLDPAEALAHCLRATGQPEDVEGCCAG